MAVNIRIDNNSVTVIGETGAILLVVPITQGASPPQQPPFQIPPNMPQFPTPPSGGSGPQAPLNEAFRTDVGPPSEADDTDAWFLVAAEQAYYKAQTGGRSIFVDLLRCDEATRRLWEQYAYQNGHGSDSTILGAYAGRFLVPWQNATRYYKAG